MEQQEILQAIRELLRSRGWQWLEGEINAYVEKKRTRLEDIPDYQLDKEQGYIKGLRWPRKKIDEIIKQGTDNAST